MQHPRRCRGFAVLVLVALVVAGCGGGDASSSTGGTGRGITVAAASDLRFAFEEVGARFTEETGVEVTFSFGSSGQLREQIINGAPFDLFASADTDFVDAVIDAGRGDPDTKADYGIGRIALWSPSGIELPSTVEDLAGPRYRRIAIANPTHAPYGAAAEQALASAGVLGEVRDRLVLGENISDTLRIAQSGNADVAVVALSLVIAADDRYVLVDDALHEPLRQALVVTATGQRGDDARELSAFLAGPTGREIMVRYGFALPGDALPT